MKQTVVDVLMYLFENIIGEDHPIDPERELVVNRLEELGFPQHEILKAFDWLEDLVDIQGEVDEQTGKPSSIRIYSDLRFFTRYSGYALYGNQSIKNFRYFLFKKFYQKFRCRS